MKAVNLKRQLKCTLRNEITPDVSVHLGTPGYASVRQGSSVGTSLEVSRAVPCDSERSGAVWLLQIAFPGGFGTACMSSEAVIWKTISRH